MKPEMANLQIATSNAVNLARECLYRFLAAAVTDPYAPGWDSLLDPASQQLASQAGAVLREESDDDPQALAFGELPPEHLDVDPLIGHFKASRSGVRADYDRIFGLVVPRECPPYETEYHRAGDAFFRAQQLADVAGFYRAFGVDPATSRPERADHIALELEFMALLITKQRLAAQERDVDQEKIAQLCADAERKFFAEHLVWWVPAFATGLGRKAEHGFYAALAKTLSALIAFDRFHFGVDAPLSPANPSLIERPEEQSGCAACPISV